MNAILSPALMRAADADTMKYYGISSLQLMEQAAEAASHICRELIPSASTVLVLCGCGNNGGDGFAMARMLMEHARLRVVVLGAPERMTEETRINYDRCRQLGIPIEFWLAERTSENPSLNADVLIDALMGIGGTEELRGEVLSLLTQIQRLKCLRIAVDIPSGLNAETGIAHERAFRADHCISMAARKQGMCLRQGPDLCGQIHVADIGIPAALLDVHAEIFSAGPRDVQRLWRKRSHQSSKFDYGRLCVVAGSRDMPGAAALCANAAIRSGAGVVELCSPAMHPALLPEVLQSNLRGSESGMMSKADLDKVLASCAKADALVLGCGSGASQVVKEIFNVIISEFESSKRIVVDADALRAIDATRRYSPNLVLSPHASELRHVLGASYTGKELYSAAEKLGCLIVNKSRPVEVIGLPGVRYWNVFGNPGMATAGSGDVLAGVIGGSLARLSAQHDPQTILVQEIACAVAVHAMAGDMAADLYGQEALSASHILEQLPHAWRYMLDGQES